MTAVERLRALYDAGTKGEWRECGAGRGGCHCLQIWSTSADSHIMTAAKEGDDPDGACLIPADEAMANAALTAAMHAALPDLLAVVEAAERLDFCHGPDCRWHFGKSCDCGIDDLEKSLHHLSAGKKEE